ncbi:MAG: DUF1566 domain-containing protein [Planctomycetota bacterium]
MKSQEATGRATSLAVILAIGCWVASAANAGDYVVVDTRQNKCFDLSDVIPFPLPGQPFCGQDAPYLGNLPGYTVSQDALTVYDHHTGLTWQRTPDTNGDGDLDSDDKLTWSEAQGYPATLNAQGYGGYNDWRTPSIKELYSLIDFRGVDPPIEGPGVVPFIDTDFFEFVYGDVSAGERIIDAQYWSSTEYVGGGGALAFGVNFADGRIKGYPKDPPGDPFTAFVRCVRGDQGHGQNHFVDNGDGTITDQATGLVWMQDDSGTGYNWEEALEYAENLALAGYDDWRLPNAKELQSIVDYTRSPSSNGSAAIDPIFQTTPIIDEAGNTNFAFYWTGTTHIGWMDHPGEWAVYIAFGEALGYIGPPGMGRWVDVHGAGAQRSDPKAGDPDQWPYGHGPQGDAVRIYNYVRCVRGGTWDALQADAYTISAAAGGTIGLALDAGTGQAHRSYFTLGSMSGTQPGITFITGITLPLNPDLFMSLLIQLVNSPSCPDFAGVLDGSGAHGATLSTLGPIPPEAAGYTLYFAYVLYNPVDFASNPIAIDIEP